MATIQSPQAGACRGLADYHVHTVASVDGRVPAADYIAPAVSLGLAEIGFADHVDLDPRDPGCGYFDYARYRQEVAAARAAAAGRLTVRTAFEITYQSNREEEIRRFLADKEVDYCLGSAHLIEDTGGWCNVSEPETPVAYYAARDKRTVYRQYWAELRAATASGLFDLLAHLDLIKRYAIRAYGPFCPDEFADEIREVLRLAIDRGVGLEINASGWRQPPAEPYPALTILHWYREMGGEILTLGSDVHWLPHLCYGLPQAAALARAVGFKAVALFARRRLAGWLDLPA